jgi:hypothetical protein
MSTVHDQTHALHFTDGPLEGHVYHLTGVVPFAQFQIGGTMEEPVFNLYGLDIAQEKPKDTSGDKIYYKFLKTFTFEEMSKIMPPQEEPPEKFGS